MNNNKDSRLLTNTVISVIVGIEQLQVFKMLLSIDERDERPIYQQLISQVREQVREGGLKPGDELPSVRELANSLGVNMHTVRNAYLKLRDQGIIIMRLGRRASIAHFQPPLLYANIEDDLKIRLKDLINDALSMGLSNQDFHDLVERQMKQAQKDG